MMKYIYEVYYSTILKPDDIYSAYFYMESDLNMFLDIAGDILLIVHKVFRYEKTNVTGDFLNKEDA